MRHLTPQSMRDRRVSLHNFNGMIRGIMQGALAVASGKGLRSQASGGQVRLSIAERAENRLPFEVYVSARGSRKVKVNAGRFTLNEMIYAWNTTETTLSSTSGDYYLSLTISHIGSLTVTGGELTWGGMALDASTTAPESRGWSVWDRVLLVPLAKITVASSVITSIVKYHPGGDLYRQIDYPGSVKVMTAASVIPGNWNTPTGYISIPPGWRVCDGTDGVLDSRGRFWVGMNKDDTDYDTEFLTGGTKEHTHDDHSVPAETVGTGALDAVVMDRSPSDLLSHNTVDHRPPYVAVCKIQKI